MTKKKLCDTMHAEWSFAANFNLKRKKKREYSIVLYRPTYVVYYIKATLELSRREQ